MVAGWFTYRVRAGRADRDHGSGWRRCRTRHSRLDARVRSSLVDRRSPRVRRPHVRMQPKRICSPSMRMGPRCIASRVPGRPKPSRHGRRVVDGSSTRSPRCIRRTTTISRGSARSGRTERAVGVSALPGRSGTHRPIGAQFQTASSRSYSPMRSRSDPRARLMMSRLLLVACSAMRWACEETVRAGAAGAEPLLPALRALDDAGVVLAHLGGELVADGDAERDQDQVADLHVGPPGVVGRTAYRDVREPGGRC